MTSKQKEDSSLLSSLTTSLNLLDPLIQFLTKATHRSMIPLSLLRSTLPSSSTTCQKIETAIAHIPELSQRGIIVFDDNNSSGDDAAAICVGFPPPSSDLKSSLHGCTKTAAKKRLAALKRSFKTNNNTKQQQQQTTPMTSSSSTRDDNKNDCGCPSKKKSSHCHLKSHNQKKSPKENTTITSSSPPSNRKRKRPLPPPSPAISSFRQLLLSSTTTPSTILHASTHSAQSSRTSPLPSHLIPLLPPAILSAFHLHSQPLYSHQILALTSLLSFRHTLITTGTGSGKSLCFLLPIFTRALRGETSLIMYPTKALARDQYEKMVGWKVEGVEVGIVDGDVEWGERRRVLEGCSVVLSNPDTVHASILPQWKNHRHFLSRLRYVIIDEAHTYTHTFGTHVSLVLRRLARIAMAVSTSVTFVGCSATFARSRRQFSRLCGIVVDDLVVVGPRDDGSPRGAKHLLLYRSSPLVPRDDEGRSSSRRPPPPPTLAEDTSTLLSRLILSSVPTIAFCSSRSAVERIYSKTLSLLPSSHERKLTSYRGGYAPSLRRDVERSFFSGEVTGIVATEALELGIDVGCVRVTIHAGWPRGGWVGLRQQMGRGGRGGGESWAVVVCGEGNPVERYLWKKCEGVGGGKGWEALGGGEEEEDGEVGDDDYGGWDATGGEVLKEHLLCAAREFPLVGNLSVGRVVNGDDGDETTKTKCQRQRDVDLFGGEDSYRDAVKTLKAKGHLTPEEVRVGCENVIFYKTHPVIDNPHANLTLRSIEPISYAIVDISLQHNQTDRIHSERAIMDTIPYSRIFHHVYPGAVLMQRGKKYRIRAMTVPPTSGVVVEGEGRRRSARFTAFAEPSKVAYVTRPNRRTLLTVVRKVASRDITVGNDGVVSSSSSCSSSPTTRKNDDNSTTIVNDPSSSSSSSSCRRISLCSTGIVTLKHELHSYSKLSPVTYTTLSEHELTLPPMEYDTNAVWIDLPSADERPSAEGMHALTHAILAVAPLFVPTAELDGDHEPKGRRIMVYDAKAGGEGWCRCLFERMEGVLEAAVSLLDDCRFCDDDGGGGGGEGNDGGCPRCLYAVNGGRCGNGELSRREGGSVGRRVLQLWKGESDDDGEDENLNSGGDKQRVMRHGKALKTVMTTKSDFRFLEGAKERGLVVGRAGWPMDGTGDEVPLEGGRRVEE